jgi:hypothetical protein
VKPYLFHVKIDQEDDGRWSSWIKMLPSPHYPRLRRLTLTKTNLEYDAYMH